MLVALGWWSILLFTKNRDAFVSKAELQLMVMIANKEVQSNTEFLETPIYLELMEDYKRQEWMIVGEALVFAVIWSLVYG